MTPRRPADEPARTDEPPAGRTPRDSPRHTDGEQPTDRYRCTGPCIHQGAPVDRDGSTDLGWVDDAVVSGDADVLGHDTRRRLFRAVRQDPTGPEARRLLLRATDARAAVRRSVLTLLASLVEDLTWGVAPRAGADDQEVAAAREDAAAVARNAFADVDDAVRRAAAKLLVAAAGWEQAADVLDRTQDVHVRVAVLRAAARRAGRGRTGHGSPWRARLRRLTTDAVPAVRLVANLELLLTAEAPERADLDAAVHADLPACDTPLEGAPDVDATVVGGEWGSAMVRHDRPQDATAWVGRLTAPRAGRSSRVAGVALASVAMRRWRAAPVDLAPALVPMLDGATEDRAGAARVLCASLTSTRLTADRLADLLDDPGPGGTVASALGSVGDLRAVPYLVRRLRELAPLPRLGEGLGGVARAGAEPELLVAVAREALAALPLPGEKGFDLLAAAPAVEVLSALGPMAAPAVPELVARLPVEHDARRPILELSALCAIGPAASAAVPALRRIVDLRGRAGEHAVRTLLEVSQDRDVADEYLSRWGGPPRRCRLAPDLLAWLTEHGGLTAQQDVWLTELVALPGAWQVWTAGAWWRRHGAPVAPMLVERLVPHVVEDVTGLRALAALAEMGEHARAALGRLDEVVADPRRCGMNLPAADDEMRRDEVLLAAAVATRARIRGEAS